MRLTELMHSELAVCARELDVPRRRDPLRACALALRRAGAAGPGPRRLPRLAARNLLPPGHAHHQPHRQGPRAGERGLWRLARGVARSPLLVHRFCVHGWRTCGQCGACLIPLDMPRTPCDGVCEGRATANTYYVLQCILVLKYILNHYPEQYTYYGYANVSQNVALMLSSIVLWISQSVSTEYEYTLSI